MIREVREESGLHVIPDTIKEFGSVLRVQQGINEDEVFEQENLYYYCNVEEIIEAQELDDYEAEEGFTLEFVTPQDAIKINRNSTYSFLDPLMFEREAKVLEILTYEFK